MSSLTVTACDSDVLRDSSRAPLGIRERWAAFAAAATLAVGTTLTPQTLESAPVLCPLRRTLGIPCPGCGLTRSCSACLHGDLAASFDFHPFGPFVCLVAAVALALFAVGLARGTRPLERAMRAVRCRAPLRFAGVLALATWLAWAAIRAAAAIVC